MLPLPLQDIDQEHRSFAAVEYAGYSEEELLHAIGNTPWVLPASKIGPRVHMPCAGLSTGRQLFLDDESEMAANLAQLGWRKCRYLVILPYPQNADIELRTPLSRGTTCGMFMRRQLEEAGIPLDEVVVTHVARFSLPETVKTYGQRHKRSCIRYLQDDIVNCQPEVIIACGADAMKALYGQKIKLDNVRGSVMDFELTQRVLVEPAYDDFYWDDDTEELPEAQPGPEYKELTLARAKVIPTASHLTFLSGYANLSVFQSELRRAWEIVEGFYTPPELYTNYRVCSTLSEVEELYAEIGKSNATVVAMDTEWGNDVGRDEFRKILSVQFAWNVGCAAFVDLREVSPDELDRVWRTMQNIMLDPRWKIAAHNLRADVESFHRAGYPIDERVDDGVDTMLIHHLLCGDEDQGLDHLVRKYVPEFGAFWQELEEWLDQNKRKSTLKYGYRDIPKSILIPYALRDADATWRIAQILLQLLDDAPKLRSLYWNHVTLTSAHLLDVERNGILVDDRIRMELREHYLPMYDAFLTELRSLLNWPGFNPGSKDQVATALFHGQTYKNPKPLPEGARSLGLEPLMNTDKYPKPWDDIVAAGETELHTPSTKATTIDIYLKRYPKCRELRLLKHLSVVGKFLSAYLAPIEVNEHGVTKEGAGFANNIWADFRVRTSLSQLTQTGRYSSKSANLQTKPKKQEAAAVEAYIDFKFGMTKKEYQAKCDSGEIPKSEQLKIDKFASVFIASEGCVMVEADFKTAELFGWAYCSGDTALIKVLASGRDIHSELAISSFRLPHLSRLGPAIEALDRGERKAYDEIVDDIKENFGALRIAAKSVIFGVMYGRGANALANEINKVVKEPVSRDDTQALIDLIAASYPDAWGWLEKNADHAVTVGWVENIFGRRRYFQGVQEMSGKDQAAVRREAKNSPIQGLVADLLAQAGYLLHRTLKELKRQGMDLGMKILLPVHDAFLFEVPIANLEKCLKLIKHCMSTANKIPGTDYTLGLDIEVFRHSWGDHGVSPSKPDFKQKLAEWRAAA